MNLTSRCDLASLLALLTQWMLSQLMFTNMLPRSTVSFLLSRVTIISFIAFRFFLGVCFTKPFDSQVRTTGVRTRTLGLYGHQDHLGGKQKALAVLREGFLNSIFLSLSYQTDSSDKQ